MIVMKKMTEFRQRALALFVVPISQPDFGTYSVTPLLRNSRSVLARLASLLHLLFSFWILVVVNRNLNIFDAELDSRSGIFKSNTGHFCCCVEHFVVCDYTILRVFLTTRCLMLRFMSVMRIF